MGYEDMVGLESWSAGGWTGLRKDMLDSVFLTARGLSLALSACMISDDSTSVRGRLCSFM